VPAVNVLGEILDWSTDRPMWQRDALRRLIVQGELKSSEVGELVEHCKASHGLAKKSNPEPLEAKHVPQAGDTGAAVMLNSLTHQSGVNALANDQTIEFGPALTVVYGANAAGKSGYTRILKRACRARGAEEVLGHVVSGSAPGRPSAMIKFSVGGQPRGFGWDDSKPADKSLSRVSVFDRHCASVYISEETDVAFRPLGLDLFDKLSDACEAVRRALERERRELELAAVRLPDVAAGTAVHTLLTHLTSLTNADEVKALATLKDEEVANITELRARLRDLQSENPQKTARALELRTKRVEGLQRNLQEIAKALSSEAIATVFMARDRVRQTTLAAANIQAATFGRQPLPSTGSDAWRVMWKAAERFSTEDAYPDDPFPKTDTNSRCVLCQQKLTEEGAERLRRFQEFLNSSVQRERDEATSQLQRLRKQLENLVVSDNPTREALDELQLDEPALRDASAAFLDGAEHRRLVATNALASNLDTPNELRTQLVNPPSLLPLIEKLRRRIGELREMKQAEAVVKIEAQLRELDARQILARHQTTVLGEIERKKRLAAYQLCLDDTKTTAVTRKSSEVTKVAVTEQLAQSFKQELADLKFEHVEVEMVAAGGSRGALYHKLQLRRAPGVSVPKVVSEGEARCLSIASFFAELSTAADRSAILFDDPVSSLDHLWRDKVAGRLVKEAQSRQVVVFTHDIVFLLALEDQADQVGVQFQPQYLRRISTSAGLIERRLPQPAMKVKDRIGYLKELWQQADKLQREGKQSEYEHEASRIYGLLREAWERAVEEVLLNGVIERYRSNVETQRVEKLHDIESADCKNLEVGMAKCSRWLTGHDKAPAENAAFPASAELQSDIKALEDWVKKIRDRRK
jgi:ABC-type lipoprotein export system ATPase subunit